MARNSNINTASEALKSASESYAQQTPSGVSPLTNVAIPNLAGMNNSASQKWMNQTIRSFDDHEGQIGVQDRATHQQKNSDKEGLADAKKLLASKKLFLQESEKSGKLSQQDLQFAQGQVKLAKEQLKIKQTSYDTSKRASQQASFNASQRQQELAQFKQSASGVSQHLQSLDDKRKSSVRHHLIESGVGGGLKKYGMSRMNSSARHLAGLGGEEGASMMGSVGGLAMGGLALGAASIASVLIQAIAANMHNSIQGSDIYKGTGGGVSSRTFIDQAINRSLGDGLGLSAQEGLQGMSALQKQSGSLIKDYGGALTATAGLDRMTGSQIGTYGNTFSYLARNTQQNTTASGSKDFSIQFASELGRGKLAGLGEETVKGIESLVEITKRSSVDGPDASKYLNLISTMSSSGKKGLMGGNAAETLASIDSAIKNPTNQIGEVLSMQSVASTMQRHGMKGYADPLSVINATTEGIGLQDDKGNQIGQELPAEMLKRAVAMVGKDPSMRGYQENFLSTQLKIGHRTAGYLMDHPTLLDPNSPHSLATKYGLDAEALAKPGGLMFAENLGEADSRHPNDRGSAMREAVGMVQKNFGLDSQFSKGLTEIMNGSGTFEQKSKLLSETISDGGATKEDALRVGENFVETKLLSMMGVVVDELTTIASVVVGWAGTAQQKADLKESQLLAKADGAKIQPFDVSVKGESVKSWKDNLLNNGKLSYVEDANARYIEMSKGFTDKTSDYKDLIKKSAAEEGIPFEMLASTINTESIGGHARARHMNNNKTLDVGLGQINTQVYEPMGFTEEQMMDPQLNAKITAQMLKKSWEASGHNRELAYGIYQAGNANTYLYHKRMNDKTYNEYYKGNIAKKMSGEKAYMEAPPQTTSEATTSSKTGTEHTVNVNLTDPTGNKATSQQSSVVVPGKMNKLKTNNIYFSAGR